MGVGLKPQRAQAGVDVLGQHAEVRVDRGVVGVGVGEAVVLVGGEGELAAGGAAEGKPGVGHRRRAVALIGELEQARGHGVASAG